MANRDAYRRYCRICWYGGRCWRIALVGSFQSATNWGGILGIAILGFGLRYYFGRELMPAETWQETAVQGLFFIAAAWVVIFLFRLIFIAPFIIRREGTWYGDTFVFKEPRLAFHLYARPSENNIVHNFSFPDAPPFALVNYKIEFDGPREFISGCVMADWRQLPDFKTPNDLYYTKGSIRVGKYRKMCMTTFMRGMLIRFLFS
jgi:hypothetical protein